MKLYILGNRELEHVHTYSAFKIFNKLQFRTLLYK